MPTLANLLLSCWSLLGATLPAAGQLLWDRTTGTTAYNETSSAFLSVPDGYINVGKGGGNGTSAALPNTFYLSKVDRAGLVLWQKNEAFPARNIRVLEQLGAAATATGEIYATGQCTELVPVHPARLYAFGLLVKFSPTGDTLCPACCMG